jgi:hypothetical protein
MLKVKAITPRLLFEDTDQAQSWSILATGGPFGFAILDGGLVTLSIAPGAPTSIVVDPDGQVGMGVLDPTQALHVSRNQNANSFFLLQNPFNGLNAAAVVRTQADVAIQNFQSHATSRTLVRWGVPLGGWNEFLSFVGNGLAMGTFGNAPFILGTSATARMTFDGNSDVIDFAGGGQYDGNSFLDASSRALKQDIRPLGPTAAAEALAELQPVTFAYTGTPGDPRVGFVAEDVPDLVARPGRTTLSPLDIVAVLTRVVQEQQKAMLEQQRQVEAQQRALAELAARLQALEARP